MRTEVLVTYLIWLLSKLVGIVYLLQHKLPGYILGSSFCRQNLQKGGAYIFGRTDMYLIKQNLNFW